jgi:hypothetical protein
MFSTMRPLLGWLFLIFAGLVLAYTSSFVWWVPVALIAWAVVIWAMPKDNDGKLVPLLAWSGILLLLVAAGTYLRSLL